MHRIVICSTCQGTDGKGFAARLGRALAAPGARVSATVEVVEHACLSACAHPLAMGFAAPGKATYLFGDVDAHADLDDTVAFARMYVDSRDGWIEDARGAGRLRFCLLGRVPG